MDIAFKYLIIHMDPLDHMARDLGQKNFKDEMQLAGAKVFQCLWQPGLGNHERNLLYIFTAVSM